MERGEKRWMKWNDESGDVNGKWGNKVDGME